MSAPPVSVVSSSRNGIHIGPESGPHRDPSFDSNGRAQYPPNGAPVAPVRIPQNGRPGVRGEAQQLPANLTATNSADIQRQFDPRQLPSGGYHQRPIPSPQITPTAQTGTGAGPSGRGAAALRAYLAAHPTARGALIRAAAQRRAAREAAASQTTADRGGGLGTGAAAGPANVPIPANGAPSGSGIMQNPLLRSPEKLLAAQRLHAKNEASHASSSSVRKEKKPSEPVQLPADETWRESVAAPSVRLEHLNKMLDMTRFLGQLERLLAQPIKIPGSSVVPYPTSRPRHSIFSVKAVWPTDSERQENTSKLYNFKNIRSRQWLKDLILEESDSESDGEAQFTTRDLHALMKVHRKRRKLQKFYHTEPGNSQFTYYGAGLLSVHDPFPEHQATVLRQQSRN